MPATRSLALLSRIAASPGRAMAAILGLHAAVWTALPTLLYPNLPLDLIEALVYGREWQLGYDKLPPLPWWLVEIVNRPSVTISPTTCWRSWPWWRRWRRYSRWRGRSPARSGRSSPCS